MKIAVVSPSPVPFTIGGAENLAWGLCESINKNTKHQAELIKLPTKEHSFWDLIDSYRMFYNLDLTHFDLVISTKYPSWMIPHDNQIVWMLHTLRGLYDTYHLMGLPGQVKRGVPEIDEILDYMQTHPFYDQLEEFFNKLYALKNKPIPQEYFAFPGPFIRDLIHYMDRVALDRPGLQKHCAISDTVKKRKDYFPENATVETIYPPTILKDATCKEGEFFFMCSRLDGPKRIDMLIRAMKHVKSDTHLYIAGTGPEKARLEELSKDDPRIHLMGFVSDEEVNDYYARAICVPYFPMDEDYGYITIEAMMHQKPVLTTVDAGGPNEFVENGKTGFVVPFDEMAIAEKLDYLASHKDEAKTMGQNAEKKVKEITWEKATEDLLKDIDENGLRPKRQRIVVALSYSIYPPQGGGQARIFGLYKNLARDVDVELVCLTHNFEKYRCRRIAPGMVETVIPRTDAQQARARELEAAVGVPATDMDMILFGDLTPKYTDILKKKCVHAQWVVISHPYAYPQVKSVIDAQPNLKMIHEAHNVEYLLKEKMYQKGAYTTQVLNTLRDTEGKCCTESALIMTCSQQDKDKIVEMYHADPSRIFVVPNGVDCSDIHFISIAERMENKKKKRLEKETVGMFMGSYHQPNLEAAESVIEVAKKCKKVRFLLLGSQCEYFRHKKLPSNVALLGLVTEEEKAEVASCVDFALNLMESGSGTNLKMFDYMASGIPTITTEFGARGIDDLSLFITTSVENADEAVRGFELEKCDDMVKRARAFAEKVFDWSVVAASISEKIRSL
ncbi:MAG: glycosyltransferase family 4 protein [Clostridiales bacterium]|nr:glycosyltransferase family 4 protein [Clostridiales bacterium]